MKSIRIAFVAGAILALIGTAAAADVAELRVRCDYKAPNSQGKGERTRVRVDGKEVAEGTYTVTVTDASATTYTATAVTVADDDEFEFKTRFSSNRGHITGGATAVPANLGATGPLTITVAELSYTTTLSCPGRLRTDLQ